MFYFVKLKPFQKIYVVFGDPKKQVILSGIITGIHINCKDFENKESTVYYTYSRIKFIRAKDKAEERKFKNSEIVECGSVCQEFIDCKEKCKSFPVGMSNWPVFTSKEKCIEYLRKFK